MKGKSKRHETSQALGRSLRQILVKITERHFHSTSYEGIWPPKISNFMQGLKSAIMAIFRMDWDGCAPRIYKGRIDGDSYYTM